MKSKKPTFSLKQKKSIFLSGKKNSTGIALLIWTKPLVTIREIRVNFYLLN
jgi:hypothetical protein